jgi:hypothetical protein
MPIRRIILRDEVRRLTHPDRATRRHDPEASFHRLSAPRCTKTGRLLWVCDFRSTSPISATRAQ